MTVALLDVNVLIALTDRAHVDHDRAGTWFGRHSDDGWATCPLTENGMIRIVSSAGYPDRVPTAAARAVLAHARGFGHHEFWPCDVSILDDAAVHGERLLGSKQITDVSLLALAVRHRGRFVTFDRSIASSAVVGATAAAVVVL